MALSIGVALYSDATPYSREGNWACEYRGQPFSFSSASDLPGQTLWITNCDLQDLIEVGLNKNPKIAHHGYFRTRLNLMVQELGMRDMTPEQQCTLLAEVLGNAAAMARHHLGLAQHPIRGLAQGVGQVFGFTEPPRGSSVYKIAEQACQNYTSCERERRYEKADVFSFWMPRCDVAKSLLETPVPGNEGISVIPAHNLPDMGRNPASLVEWATENKVPLFARVKILGVEETVGKLMNYGSGASDVSGQGFGGAQYSARNQREWCALPELDMLVQSGDVHVLQVGHATGWQRSGLHVYEDRLAPVSYAYGLVAENLWYGITRRADATGSVSKSLSTAWIQAVDRMRCLQVAVRLHSIGMEVINYGNGRITVACPAAVRALIPQVALEERLFYPSSLEGLQPYKLRHEDPVHVLQHLLSKRDYSRIVQVDNALLRKMEVSRAA